MKHYYNKINLGPILFPMSLFLSFATLSKPIWLALCLVYLLLKGTHLMSYVFERHWGVRLVGNARYESWFCFRLQEHSELVQG